MYDTDLIYILENSLYDMIRDIVCTMFKSFIRLSNCLNFNNRLNCRVSERLEKSLNLEDRLHDK